MNITPQTKSSVGSLWIDDERAFFVLAYIAIHTSYSVNHKTMSGIFDRE